MKHSSLHYASDRKEKAVKVDFCGHIGSVGPGVAEYAHYVRLVEEIAFGSVLRD